jgi:hypothetical protein
MKCLSMMVLFMAMTLPYKSSAATDCNTIEFTSSSLIRGKSVRDSASSVKYYFEDLDGAIPILEYQVSYSEGYNDDYVDEYESYDSSVNKFNVEISTPDYTDSFATCLLFQGSFAQCLQFVKGSLKRVYVDGDYSHFGVDYYNEYLDSEVTIPENNALSVVAEEIMDSTSQDPDVYADYDASRLSYFDWEELRDSTPQDLKEYKASTASTVYLFLEDSTFHDHGFTSSSSIRDKSAD